MSEIIDDRYRVDARLGEGAQAVVLRVHDLHTGQDLALKRLLPAYAEKARMRARFEAEAKTLSTLDHPNVVKVLDVATDGPAPYFVMELVEGGSLVDRLIQDGPVPPRIAVAVALQICHGLSAAHGVGIIHRDVKPHNVLLGTDGTCKLTDFGIARMGEAGLRTRAGVALGTEGFMAPEQAADAKSVDVRADVYGVGMTLFVLLTGDDPWLWISTKGRPRVPEVLWGVLDRATEEKPDERQPNVQALAEELSATMELLPPDPADTRWTTLAPAGPLAAIPDAGPDPLPAEATMDELFDPTAEEGVQAPATLGAAPEARAPHAPFGPPRSMGPPEVPPAAPSAPEASPVVAVAVPAAEAGARTPAPVSPERERPARTLWLPLLAAAVLFVASLASLVGVVALGLSLAR